MSIPIPRPPFWVVMLSVILHPSGPEVCRLRTTFRSLKYSLPLLPRSIGLDDFKKLCHSSSFSGAFAGFQSDEPLEQIETNESLFSQSDSRLALATVELFSPLAVAVLRLQDSSLLTLLQVFFQTTKSVLHLINLCLADR